MSLKDYLVYASFKAHSVLELINVPYAPDDKTPRSERQRKKLERRNHKKKGAR